MGLYFGFVGPSDSVDRKTLLISGSLSGALLANMTLTSVCKYIRPDVDEANLEVRWGGGQNVVYLEVGLGVGGGGVGYGHGKRWGPMSPPDETIQGRAKTTGPGLARACSAQPIYIPHHKHILKKKPNKLR